MKPKSRKRAIPDKKEIQPVSSARLTHTCELALAFAKYRFTDADFDPDIPLSQSVTKPPLTAYIRWLRLRAERLTPNYGMEVYADLYDEWWDELVQDEFLAHCMMRVSPHATFDTDPGDEYRSSDAFDCIAPIIIASLSDGLLDTGEPNPVEDRRTRLRGGKQIRLRLHFHEMLATTALSDLDYAVDLLTSGSAGSISYRQRSEGEQIALTLVIRAADLVARAERHLEAASRQAVEETASKAHRQRRPEEPPGGNTFSITSPVAESGGEARPSNEKNGWIVEHESYLLIGYGGQTERVGKIRYGKGLNKRFSCLLKLLTLAPHQEIELVTLSDSFKRGSLQPGFSGDRQTAAQKGIASGQLSSRANPRGQCVDDPRSQTVLRLIEEAQDAREGKDIERANELAAQAEELSEQMAREAKEAIEKGDLCIRTKQLTDPSERAAIRNTGKALSGALEHLEDYFPLLHKHLKKAIPSRMSRIVEYKPKPLADRGKSHALSATG